MADNTDNNTDSDNDAGKCVFCDIVAGKLDAQKVIYKVGECMLFN